ncbi:protein cornichon homolog 4 [Neodiprion pinetum]|uniref:Protein cornichon homolog 4 n=1 Tax=Neodiprion lecontei TaxID=441921 RepID=A0A6J0C455_NEOLC|nr:protein cornichon homolog 4 [Neodiprion lecontei]XP_046416158.1 protein cornichon homolog 4 [Neodiprion fabricii]XP_046472007.1 protein cornichon homolog 4 [Neodiprion pinetum]XP_046609823.1 protein cornichon homolog 4 [Neodiprion virginianus]XP_046739053.1 protein cornichon homolog 4 [Diprion similis]
MVSEPLLFAFALFDTGAVLFLLVYFVITLSDLECDYLNAQQCCSKLNTWVLPKIVGHVFLVVLLLFHGQWILMVVNLPMALWLVYEFLTVPTGNMGIYDPTEIHNHGQLKKHLRDCMVYLGYYLVFFFIYLYCMIIALLKGDPIRRDEDDMVEF